MGCARCGECCIDRDGTKHIGGTDWSDDWLRHRVFQLDRIEGNTGYFVAKGGECRFLLPPNKKGQRLCAIHNHPLRPDACRDFPNIPNAAIPEGCKQGRKVPLLTPVKSKSG